MRSKNWANRKQAVESAAFGLGYTAVLIWSGSALAASFTGGEAGPYGPNIPRYLSLNAVKRRRTPRLA